MRDEELSYRVDGVVVTLVRDHNGAHWLCSRCSRDCEHVLKAAVWMTLRSWPIERTELH
jgi:hypothetical protein